jgi:hypothetical protein
VPGIGDVIADALSYVPANEWESLNGDGFVILTGSVVQPAVIMYIGKFSEKKQQV